MSRATLFIGVFIGAGVILPLGGCMQFREDYYIGIIDPNAGDDGEARPAQFYRFRLRGHAKLGKSRFEAGWYDAYAVERLFGEVTPPGDIPRFAEPSSADRSSKNVRRDDDAAIVSGVGLVLPDDPTTSDSPQDGQEDVRRETIEISHVVPTAKEDESKQGPDPLEEPESSEKSAWCATNVRLEYVGGRTVELRGLREIRCGWLRRLEKDERNGVSQDLRFGGDCLFVFDDGDVPIALTGAHHQQLFSVQIIPSTSNRSTLRTDRMRRLNLVGGRTQVSYQSRSVSDDTGMTSGLATGAHMTSQLQDFRIGPASYEAFGGAMTLKEPRILETRNGVIRFDGGEQRRFALTAIKGWSARVTNAVLCPESLKIRARGPVLTENEESGWRLVGNVEPQSLLSSGNGDDANSSVFYGATLRANANSTLKVLLDESSVAQVEIATAESERVQLKVGQFAVHSSDEARRAAPVQRMVVTSGGPSPYLRFGPEGVSATSRGDERFVVFMTSNPSALTRRIGEVAKARETQELATNAIIGQRYADDKIAVDDASDRLESALEFARTLTSTLESVGVDGGNDHTSELLGLRALIAQWTMGMGDGD